VDNVLSVSWEMDFCLLFKCNACVNDLTLMYCFIKFCSLGTKSSGRRYLKGAGPMLDVNR